jgi:cbb3-type cytochrome oxidase subunit 1
MDSAKLILNRLVRAVELVGAIAKGLFDRHFWPIMIGVGTLVIIIAVLSTNAKDDNRQACLEAGYSEMVSVNLDYYCIRLVDGSTQVTNLEDLE